MTLPLYLAMTPAEMSRHTTIPGPMAFMACQFSPCTPGITGIPEALTPGAMLILNDRFPPAGHCPELSARQIAEAADRLSCSAVLLDFQRPPDPESRHMVQVILDALSCPCGVSAGYEAELPCPVFLPPAPLFGHLNTYLAPWAGREIWLEAALSQELVTAGPDGTTCSRQFPPDRLEGGFLCPELLCRYRIKTRKDRILFTLFDTRETLLQKLELAGKLGVTRAVGLFQELQEQTKNRSANAERF